ncbi:alanine transaminase [Strigomonas culicis]|uniref:Alanine transaminase n=3 Tax=Strigomonas culicis TaxID=28005 RepID=S9V501_9TRYP|nr:alanine transaminase [Strigomonas culicis]|eukprot:EPY21996.1 alanine transaminase [Strigomonas culicis]
MLHTTLAKAAAKLPLNPRVVAAQYAVRGLIPTRADEINKEIASGKGGYPFQSLVYCNIGNPQALKQPPLTFYRQVMSLVDSPFLLEDEVVVSRFPKDVVERAREYLKRIGPTATGAYTGSLGYDFAREAVAAYINERDGQATPLSTADGITLTDGASTGVRLLMQTLISGPSDGVMIPIPQYPAYTAQIALLGGVEAPYYLKEAEGWGVHAADLKATYDKCVNESKATPRLFVAINPGNPTGNVLERTVMEDIVRFCYDHNMVLLADEVYQVNIYAAGKKFTSFREVVLRMPEPYNKTMLVSLHSTSKGVIGECGRRGGYFEQMNLPADLHAELVKMCSINLCSNVNGQVMTALMCSPPAPGGESHASFTKEFADIFDGMKTRAAMLAAELNTVVGFSCQPVEGAMYAFPRLTLPAAYARHNDELNAKEGRKLSLDARWALELLESEGIVVVPGSGFGQEPGTLHFRTTILPPTEQMARVVKSIRTFQEGLYATYKD